MRIIKCEKLTSLDLLQEAASSTTGKPSGMSLKRAYESGHSIIRTQLFWIEMEIPSFLSVHLVRHKIGVEHFVRSLREDRGGPPPETVTRETPVRHAMLINAEALISMAHKRLCMKAHHKARFLLSMIRQRLVHLDPDLVGNMVPLCVYRGGLCGEFGSCKIREEHESGRQLINIAVEKYLAARESDSETTTNLTSTECRGVLDPLNEPSLTNDHLPGLDPIDTPRLDALNTGERS